MDQPFPISRFVRIPLAAKVLGLTEKAIRRKIEDGIWREGSEYVRGPDGRIYIDLRGVSRWLARVPA